MQNFRTCLEQTRRKKTDVLYAFAGEIYCLVTRYGRRFLTI